MKVKIEKSNVRKIGDQLISNANSLDHELKKIIVVFDKLSSCWVGDDIKKLDSSVKGVYLPNMQKLCDKWESYGKYLRKIPNVYDEVDNTYYKKKMK